MIFNIANLKSYQEIFGIDKMRFLWKEYIEQSTLAWTIITDQEWDKQRVYFHNWRSSSMVFGMEDFAAYCAKIEENILKRRYKELPKQIKESKVCYDQSIAMVKQMMQQTGEDNE